MENTEQNVEDVELQQEEEAVDAGGLPSAQEDKQVSLDKFSIDEDIQSKYFKDGKINGKYETIKDLIEGAKSYEDKYSQVMRDIKSGKYQESSQQQEPAQVVDVVEVAQPVIAKFIDNGFSYEGLESEIKELSERTGKSVAEIKLSAIEMKEQIISAYNVVGGKEEYNAMLNWAKENLSDAKKKAFDDGLKTVGAGEYAIKGLYAEYKSANKSIEQEQRIMGTSTQQSGVRPYATQAEVLRDKAYLNSTQGRTDMAAKEMFNKRMNITPDNVVFGR